MLPAGLARHRWLTALTRDGEFFEIVENLRADIAYLAGRLGNVEQDAHEVQDQENAADDPSIQVEEAVTRWNHGTAVANKIKSAFCQCSNRFVQ